MKLSHDRYLAAVRIKARPKSLAARAALMIWIDEDCVLNVRCNDPKFKFGKLTFTNPPFIPKGAEVRGLVQTDDKPQRGTSIEFALILQSENVKPILVAEMTAK
jgi:hypothetical protein